MLMSGCAALSLASAARTPSVTSISLAPRERTISKPTTGLPSSSAAERLSATVSLTPGDLVEADAPAVGERDFHAAELLGRLHGGDGAHRLLGAAQVGAAARGFLLHLAQLARDVGGGGVERQQARRVELDAHLRDTPPTRDTAPTPRTASMAFGDLVVDEPGERLVVHLLRGHRVGEDGRAGEVDLLDHRVAQVGRQVGAHARDGVAHVVHRLLRRLSRRNSAVIVTVPSVRLV